MGSLTFKYKFIFIMVFVTVVFGIELHAYRVPSGGIRYSSLAIGEFARTMNLLPESITLIDTHNISQIQVRRTFGKQGLKNLISIGIANPSANDLAVTRFKKAPTATPVFDGDPLISKIFNYSRMRSLDPFFVMALVRTESNFKAHAKSHVGAMGLMQIMPATASLVAGRKISETMLTDPNTNLYSGTYHLRDLLVKYKNPITALSAWNAGEGAVKKYGSVPPYPETIKFGADVMTRWKNYRKSFIKDKRITKCKT